MWIHVVFSIMGLIVPRSLQDLHGVPNSIWSISGTCCAADWTAPMPVTTYACDFVWEVPRSQAGGNSTKTFWISVRTIMDYPLVLGSTLTNFDLSRMWCEELIQPSDNSWWWGASSLLCSHGWDLLDDLSIDLSMTWSIARPRSHCHCRGTSGSCACPWSHCHRTLCHDLCPGWRGWRSICRNWLWTWSFGGRRNVWLCFRCRLGFGFGLRLCSCWSFGNRHLCSCWSFGNRHLCSCWSFGNRHGLSARVSTWGQS